MAYANRDEIQRRIVEGITLGRSLRSICLDEGVPDRCTILDWLDGDEAFAAKYARARELQADLMDDIILEAADACTVEDHQVVKVRIAAYQWRAAKLRPKRYGDTRAVALTGADGGPIAVKHVEELSELELARIASDGR